MVAPPPEKPVLPAQPRSSGPPRVSPVVLVVEDNPDYLKGDRGEVLAHGFDGYISKPIDEKALMHTLNEVFHGNS